MARKKHKPIRVNKHTDLSVKVTVGNEEHLYDHIKKIDNPFMLILDGIQDPHNLGACLRTADAAGVDAVIVPKDRAVSLTDTVRKIACGAAETVPFFQVTNIATVMTKLKEAGVWLVGTSDRAKQSLYNIDLKGSICIVVGAEADGIRRLTSDSCDFLVSIPMRGKVPCLNASVATGVTLFEALRQRIAKK